MGLSGVGTLSRKSWQNGAPFKSSENALSPLSAVDTPTPVDLAFAPGRLPPEAFQYQHYQATLGVSKAQAKRIVRRLKDEVVWLSKTHQVNVTPFVASSMGAGQWLSIKKLDKSPISTRDELAQVMRRLLPGYSGFEVLPAPFRLVDSANQYHLWCFPREQVQALRELAGPPAGERMVWESPWLPDAYVVVHQRECDDWRQLYTAKEREFPGQEAAVYFDSDPDLAVNGCVLVLPRKGPDVAVFPFGFRERFVSDAGAVPGLQAQQRPLEDGYGATDA